MTKQNDTRWSTEIPETNDIMNNITINIFTSEENTFSYSAYKAKEYNELWNIDKLTSYSWEWSISTISRKMQTSNSYGTKAKILDFNVNTGEFSLETIEEDVSYSLLSVDDILRGNTWNLSDAKTPIKVAGFQTDSSSSSLPSIIDFVYPVVSVSGEEKVKGENLIGLQFSNSSGKLMTEGINQYSGTEYYAINKK